MSDERQEAVVVAEEAEQTKEMERVGGNSSSSKRSEPVDLVKEEEEDGEDWFDALLRKLGHPFTVDEKGRPVDDADDREKGIWNASMVYMRAQNMSSEYDMVPNNLVLYPMMFEKRRWYHCNILGCKRLNDSTGEHSTQQRFFVELIINGGFIYNVLSCTKVDGDIDNNLCIACPPNSGIVHPPAGGFICGVSKDQKIFKVPFY
uniref:DUF3615 domain-containing protein n=1 Tax=Oryza nivara TaxID=4536 RepID=A0A0E0G5F9_ORYNI